MAERVAIILAAGVSSRMNTQMPKVLHEVCEQEEQKGTAHAVLCCKQHLKEFDGETVVVCGDGPLIRAATLKTLIEKHEAGQSAVTLATAILDDPTGYGRIVRDTYGNIQGIVEDSDCTSEQLRIKEVNPSYYLFDNKVLYEAVEKVKPDNVKGEYYVTDNGVTIVDPDNTWIDIRAQIGQDTVIEPFTYIHGEVTIGRGCRVGPFAYLRSGTVLEDDVVLGVFTEVKNSTLAKSVRARHHSYIGDATVGQNVNIGAGSITANFDGKKVSRTSIGSDCYVGSGAILIAPLELRDGSHIKPGMVVSQDEIDKFGKKG